MILPLEYYTFYRPFYRHNMASFSVAKSNGRETGDQWADFGFSLPKQWASKVAECCNGRCLRYSGSFLTSKVKDIMSWKWDPQGNVLFTEKSSQVGARRGRVAAVFIRMLFSINLTPSFLTKVARFCTDTHDVFVFHDRADILNYKTGNAKNARARDLA
ncbi:hypothetical protein EV361DRAFT_864458 [Lentinula raphanica]|nr:hypothetical protein EV361DRAFT_864458 [Lentinula raphanica]